MSSLRNSRNHGDSRDSRTSRNSPDPAHTRPLSPRSVIASLLLGMHPPRMRGSLLVRWCAHLGIPEGTTRVALSRMVEGGEMRTEGGRYELAGRLRGRQSGQDWALDPALLPWDGSWALWIVRPGARPAAARAALRRAATTARVAELRDGVWGRPANLPPEATPPTVLGALAEQADAWTGRPSPSGTTRARFETEAAGPPMADLFDLVDVAARTLDLRRDLEDVTSALDGGDDRALGAAFALGAASLQQIRRDPLLPPELTGAAWPGPDLREAYRRYHAAFSRSLAAWFAAAERTGNEGAPAADAARPRT